MGGDQTKEMAGQLVDFARRLASSADKQGVTDEVLFERELVELYSTYLRSKGFMIVKRDRVVILNHEYTYNPSITALNKVDQKKLLDSADMRCAIELGKLAFRDGLVSIFDVPQDETQVSRRYELVVLQPKVAI